METRKANSTNAENERWMVRECDSVYAIGKIGGRWKMIILCRLKRRTLRFGELKREIDGISDRMLTAQLRELERDQLIIRTVYAEVPPRVDYRLTPLACELIPLWDQLAVWGSRHKEEVKEAK